VCRFHVDYTNKNAEPDVDVTWVDAVAAARVNGYPDSARHRGAQGGGFHYNRNPDIYILASADGGWARPRTGSTRNDYDLLVRMRGRAAGSGRANSAYAHVRPFPQQRNEILTNRVKHLQIFFRTKIAKKNNNK